MIAEANSQAYAQAHHNPRTACVLTSLDVDPSTPPTRIRTDLPTEEDSPARLWRKQVCELREGPGGEGVFDRGAEDCEESHEGGGEEEAVKEDGCTG